MLRKNPHLWTYSLAVSVVGITLGLAPLVADAAVSDHGNGTEAQGPAIRASASPPDSEGTAPQRHIPTPFERFGFNLGDDYQLANYQQLLEYWQRLSQESDRMLLEQIGTTEEGRPMVMAIITSPENHRNLDRYKEISRRLALAEGLTDDEARQLAAEGKAVVWIDGGLHATEVLGAQQLIELVYRMVSRDDAETLRFLDDVILLAVCANPDGLDLVADWYMKNPEPTKRTTQWVPRLWQKYAGGNNNRDFYMSTQSETTAMNNILYRQWFPQIVYNHHQSGPSGVVLFAPPYRGPFNYNLDPLVVVSIDTVGAAMHSRFLREGKPGSTMRHGGTYNTWWNGGLRTTPYFHNMIGLLTEMNGSPNPIWIPFIPHKQLPSNDLPAPIAPQLWHFRQSIEYSMTANRAVLDIASKLREDFLFNIYRMGKNSIERGSRDHWTLGPARIAAVEAAMAADAEVEGKRAGEQEGRRGRSAAEQFESPLVRNPGLEPEEETSWAALEYYEETLLDPEGRDPRGFIVPSDQDDFLTATKFVNTLIKNGVAVHRATGAFEIAGKSYPVGSYVVKSAQAFRPFVLDMFEPQVHPDDFAYPGAPPTPPYDIAGWTVAYQMGIEFDRILDGFDGPFEPIEGFAAPPTGSVTNEEGAVGFLLSPRVNDAFVAINRLLAGGEEVYRYTEPLTASGSRYPAGTIHMSASASAVHMLRRLAEEKGLSFEGTSTPPAGGRVQLRPVRLGLWDRYGGSVASGWTRWILEQFEFPFELVYPPRLDAGELTAEFDVLVLVGDPPGPAGRPRPGQIQAVPGIEPGPFVHDGAPPRNAGPPLDIIPAEYHDRLGRATVDKTIPALRQFVEDGGTIVAIGSTAPNLAVHLAIPIDNALVERDPKEKVGPLPTEKFYVPGSVLGAHVDTDHPVAWGLREHTDVFSHRSPAWRLRPDAPSQGVRAVAWFGENPLRSGWAWGETFLDGSVAAIEARLGDGSVVLFGPEITFRGQPHGTFKFLFNAIFFQPEAEPPE